MWYHIWYLCLIFSERIPLASVKVARRSHIWQGALRQAALQRGRTSAEICRIYKSKGLDADYSDQLLNKLIKAKGRRMRWTHQETKVKNGKNMYKNHAEAALDKWQSGRSTSSWIRSLYRFRVQARSFLKTSSSIAISFWVWICSPRNARIDIMMYV